MTKEEIQIMRLKTKIYWLKECIKDAEVEIQNIVLLQEFKNFKTNSETIKKCTQTLIENLRKDLERRKTVQDASTAQEKRTH